MNRRAFLAGGIAFLTAPLVADAQQQTGKVPSLGILFFPSPAAALIQEEAFQQGLREFGYVEGQNISIERRYAGGNPDLLPGLATGLVRLKVDVIVAPGSSAALAVKNASPAIPVVFALVNDPVGVGLVASLARPGNNLTGLTPMSADTGAKRLELLKEAIPGISRIAILSASTYPLSARQAMIREMEAAARLLRLEIRVLEVGGRDEFDGAFSAMAKERLGALTVLPIPLLTAERRRIVGLALRNRLPSIFQWKEWAEVGGLMSYGANQADLIRRAASYVDKILKGAKPADLPVEQATKFELIINMKTAKALGLTIPPALLLRADQVLE